MAILQKAALGIWISMLFVIIFPQPVRFRSTRQIVTAEPEPLCAYELINLINGQRTANGLPALKVNSIIMAVAQTTAETMAAAHISGHIGDVRGRLRDAGFGAGDTVFATENFVVLPAGGQNNILSAWSDPDHMRPMVDPKYTHVGAGVAQTEEGDFYYILQAAYTSSGRYDPPVSTAQFSGTPRTTGTVDPMAEYIFAVLTVTPQPDGKLIHIVKPGQSLWSIAIAYNTKIAEIARLSGLSMDNPTIYVGQKLWIPTSMGAVQESTFAATPTPTEHASTWAEKTTIPSIIPTISTPSITPEIPGSLPKNSPPDQKLILASIISALILGSILVLYGTFSKK